MVPQAIPRWGKAGPLKAAMRARVQPRCLPSYFGVTLAACDVEPFSGGWGGVRPAEQQAEIAPNPPLLGGLAPLQKNRERALTFLTSPNLGSCAAFY